MSVAQCRGCIRFLLAYRNISCSMSNQTLQFSTSNIHRKVKTASDTYKVIQAFDRNSKFIQRDRAAKREDFEKYSYIKDEIGWRVADRVFDIKRTFHNAVEFGCGPGYVSRHLVPESVTHITLCDTSQANLDKATVGEGIECKKILMDEEKFDFPENSLDLVVSSLCLHWVNDLPGCFDRILKALKPDGVLLACLFGNDTLTELRQSLQLADMERLGGVHLRVSPFTRIGDIGGLLTSAGFNMQTVDSDGMTVWYPSAWHVMRDVSAAGEGNAALTRAHTLPRDIQFAAAAIYDEMYGAEFEGKGRGVPATYRVIHFVGWKPCPTQPAPAPRGSGTVSLKDLHRIDEIVRDRREIELDEEKR